MKYLWQIKFSGGDVLYVIANDIDGALTTARRVYKRNYNRCPSMLDDAVKLYPIHGEESKGGA